MQGFAPSPKPIVSRFTPTIPVRAPPNGSRAEGELWVSDLVSHQVVVIKDDGAGIIRKYRYADVVVSSVMADCICGRLDIGPVEPVRDIVIHGGSKDRVFAVLAPGLGERLISTSVGFLPLRKK